MLANNLVKKMLESNESVYLLAEERFEIASKDFESLGMILQDDSKEDFILGFENAVDLLKELYVGK